MYYFLRVKFCVYVALLLATGTLPNATKKKKKTQGQKITHELNCRVKKGPYSILYKLIY